MKIAFFISSVGDTDLALGTIKSLEKQGHEAILISLTKTAQQRVESFKSSSVIEKKSLPEILGLNPEGSIEGRCTEEQLNRVIEFIHHQNINHAYFGVPSTNNEIPFQIAKEVNDIPVLMAYEFMFKPENHCLWNYVPELKRKPNVQWALPLVEAINDFDVDRERVHIIGHLSIDNAYLQKPSNSKNPEEIKEGLQIAFDQPHAFISSTTQPIETDTKFLDYVLTELPKHPTIQVRLGIHPGIQDLDSYLTQIISVYQKHPKSNQFKIILPDNLVARFKNPELTITNPLFQSLFLRVNINGSEAASVADEVAQAVPGALLNQAALEGKPAYSHLGKPYLPRQYFSDSITTFFKGVPQQPPTKKELGLDEKTAPERCAEIILSCS